MRLTIEGVPRLFTTIKAFREAHALPDDFGVSAFEPKDYSGLGSIDRSGGELRDLRSTLLTALPPNLSAQQWLGFIPQLTRFFTENLYAINASVNLRDVEIEFAAAGFADVCQAVVYARLRGGDMPPFEAIYGVWLDQTVRVSQTVHAYRDWQVQIVTHAYGRAGLIVRMPAERHYVQDSSLSCPAEGYMASLLAEVAARISA